LCEQYNPEIFRSKDWSFGISGVLQFCMVPTIDFVLTRLFAK